MVRLVVGRKANTRAEDTVKGTPASVESYSLFKPLIKAPVEPIIKILPMASRSNRS
jgi:hypothetical protein